MRGEILEFIQIPALEASYLLGRRFTALRKRADGRVRLVLHGTNGFQPDLLKQCVKAGVSKINVNRLVLDNYYTHFRAQAPHLAQTTLMEEGVRQVVGQTIEWMEVCGSAGKAAQSSS